MHKRFPIFQLQHLSRLACMAGLVLLSPPAHAQTVRTIHYSSGTGFFVSMQGHVITNAHVVEHCNSNKVEVRNKTIEHVEGEVIATDQDVDLALIRTHASPPHLAALRDYGGAVKAGDEAIVMGFPEERAKTGIYKVVETNVIDTAGPQGEPKWLQFSDAARQGNSGGPLLDKSGNVVGVVTGKMTLTEYNAVGARTQVVKESDVAISLPYLRKFLEANHIYYRKMTSAIRLSTPYIEQQAQNYIVNVRCETNQP